MRADFVRVFITTKDESVHCEKDHELEQVSRLSLVWRYDL